MLPLSKELSNHYEQIEKNLFLGNRNGYWSNLTLEENDKFIQSLRHLNPDEAVKKYCPELYDIIFSPKRWAGLELLELEGHETCLDCGCMWGALTVPLAQRSKHVVGMEQTFDSLKFLKSRLGYSGLSNVDLVCGDLKEMPIFQNKFDRIVINGVLEWVPEKGNIELKKYFGKKDQKSYTGNPTEIQQAFLEKINNNLSSSGKLYLAIENRYDFKQFFGAKDPHANVYGLSFLPRTFSDVISKQILGRPYVNWLYSFNALEKLLLRSGFSKVDLYACFPDYRFPQKIVPYSAPLEDFTPTIPPRSRKHKVARLLERIIFRYLRLKFFSPSIIAISNK